MVTCRNLIVLLAFCGLLLRADDACRPCHAGQVPRRPRTMGVAGKAVGIMDKGQLQNYTGNSGDLANFHLWFENAGHWPRTAEGDHQYAFGLGLLVGISESNVIETATQTMTKVTDWLPPDDAAGRHYSGEIVSISDETPFQASSDFRETWPFGYYDEDHQWVPAASRYWPGYFRVDVGNLTRPQLDQHPDALTLPDRFNEFSSDRDIFSIYTDEYNTRGSVGLEVHQTGYSYGRTYSEDFIFWDLKIFNTSLNDLNGIYVGFYVKFRPDYDNHDYINFIDSDGDGTRDLVYVYDLNNTPNKTWAQSTDPLGIPALRIYDTPGKIGVTDFHHFGRGVSPTNDEQIWALMTSDTASDYLHSPGKMDYYFHGQDQRIDYTGLDSLGVFYPTWYDEESDVDLAGDGINFIVSCGPFDLPADSMVTLSAAMIMGAAGTVPNQPDTTDLMKNTRMANHMYRLYFQGSGPPDPPLVQAVASDHAVTLTWSSEPSESSVDVLTQQRDFEGYKIFRSEDKGQTWGHPITDAGGAPAGFVPLKTFDLINDVSGLDPMYPQYLGTNSGLAHTFKDSSLINGVEYWYCVSAYDHGNQNPDSLEQSYLYPLGNSTFESHTVSAIPGIRASNSIDAAVPAGNLTPRGGPCDAIVSIAVIDPDRITGHGYKIIFSPETILSVTGGDTVYGMGFTLVDTTENDTLFRNHMFSDESRDNIPVVDGFRLKIQDAKPAVKSLGWTLVAGDTCTFDWRYQSIDPEAGNQLIQEDVNTFNDWRITVNYSDPAEVGWIDLFTGTFQTQTQSIPIRITIVTDPDNPVDVSSQCWLGEFAIPAPWEDYRIDYFSQIGWDLVSGGLGYTAASPGWYERHVDVLILEELLLDPTGTDTLPDYLYLFTNNKPDTSFNFMGVAEYIDAVAPSDGDEFTIITNKNITPDISYAFGTTAAGFAAATTNSIEAVRVVPDPYVVSNIWETGEFGKKLQFNHLPNECTIRIYTLVGEHVTTLNHNSQTGYEFWDMRTSNDQFIAPGVYIYHVRTPDKQETVGRFLVIK